MARLALDPFTPERPLGIAQQYVALIHGVLERRAEIDIEQIRRIRESLEIAASAITAEVRYDAERLMYLAERAHADGFAVHDQLTEIAAEHETEIKRLGNEVIREYKALARKLAMPQKVATALREVIDAAEHFQDDWLTVVRQMKHRAQAIGRRRTPDHNLVVAGELYAAALANAAGSAEGIALTPRVAGDMIVYELAIPAALIPAALIPADTGAAAVFLDSLHDQVAEAAPRLCGALALRIVADADAA